MKSDYNNCPLTHEWDNTVPLNAHPFCLKGGVKKTLLQSALNFIVLWLTA